jgi:hypothetical protein
MAEVPGQGDPIVAINDVRLIANRHLARREKTEAAFGNSD